MPPSISHPPFATDRPPSDVPQCFEVWIPLTLHPQAYAPPKAAPPPSRGPCPHHSPPASPDPWPDSDLRQPPRSTYAPPAGTPPPSQPRTTPAPAQSL